MDLGAFIERAGAARSLLVATDFDGTISDIGPHPAAVCARAGALEALAAIAETPDSAIAVISGRTSDSLHAQTARLLRAWRGSEHGAFLESPEGPRVSLADTVPLEILNALYEAGSAVATRVEGVRVERKLTGVSIHVREVESDERAHAIAELAIFCAEAERHGFGILEGRQVIEARSPKHTKATALATLLERLPSDTHAIFAGDDRTDDDAILLAHERGGGGVFIASAERPDPPPGADLVLSNPAAWVDVLAKIASLRSSRAVASRKTPSP